MFLRRDYMENKIIIGNMKMYMSISDIKDYLNELDGKITNNVILCPTSIYIPYFLGKNYNLAIQNIYYEDNGAYTGEVSVSQVKDIGISYVIVGHSERRKLFNETNYDINKKLIKCLKNNLKVILCIGEEEKFNNLEVLKNQLELALNNIDNKYQDNIIIAYEPVWAIGTGLIPSNDEIKDTTNFIKSFIYNNYKMNLKVVYGGSVNIKNIENLNKIDNIDGFMIGGSCTKSDEFLKIISIINDYDK